ncbi:MAG: GFA family protein [Paracoccaceae bacterium]|nr:GFA family protein [Paracoccaceae bacterium]
MIEGHCLCGAVRIVVDGDHDPRPGACHCGMCQRWSGGIFICCAAEPGSVTVTGEVARYRSSRFAERAFCPVCGSHLWMRDTDRDDATYDLMPGLFEALRTEPLRSEIYTDCAPAYAPLTGDHRRKTRAQYEATAKFVEGDTP